MRFKVGNDYFRERESDWSQYEMAGAANSLRGLIGIWIDGSSNHFRLTDVAGDLTRGWRRSVAVTRKENSDGRRFILTRRNFRPKQKAPPGTGMPDEANLAVKLL